MRLTFGAVVLITFSIIVSLFLANVAKIISTDAGLFRNNQQLEMSDSELFESSRDHRSGYGKELDDTLGDVMWFLQVPIVLFRIFGSKWGSGSYFLSFELHEAVYTS